MTPTPHIDPQTIQSSTLTQKERVLAKLLKDGEVTNVWGITQYPAILRMAAIISELKEDGYLFRGEYLEGTKNYVYYLLRSGDNLIKTE